MPIFATCPVCRERISGTYLLRPVGARWRCHSCKSLLTVDLRRRAFAIVPLIVGLPIAGILASRIGLDTLIVAGLVIAFWVPYLIWMDRPRVLERCGTHCLACGYDLRGQSAPRCPECGRDISPEQRTALATGVHPQPSAKWGNPPQWFLLVLLILFAATLFGIAIGYWSSRLRPAATQPVASTRPAAVTGEPSGW